VTLDDEFGFKTAAGSVAVGVIPEFRIGNGPRLADGGKVFLAVAVALFIGRGDQGLT
jgi:hypothetical protein